MEQFLCFGNIVISNTKARSVMEQSNAAVEPDAELDITREVCPMTFVRTRLALDRLPGGAVLRVRLRGEEPRRNVPRTASEQGHQVLQAATTPDGITTLLIRKG